MIKDNIESPIIRTSTQLEIKQLILRIYARLGIRQMLDDDIFDMIRSDIRDMLSEWRIAQVDHALKLGMKGLLGIDMNLYDQPLNTQYLTRLMIAYQVFTRPAVLKARKDAETPEPTKEQKDEMRVTNIVTSFEGFKKTGNILNAGNSVYNALKERINSDDTKLRPMAETIHKERQEAKIERTHHKTILLEVLRRAEVGEYNETDELSIERIMCDLRLEEYFNEIIEMEMNIKDLL